MVVARFFEGLTFKVANAFERDRALALRRHVYTDEHGNAGIDQLDAIATHLVAVDSHGTVVSALRVLGPAQRPFDLERFASLETILPTNSRPAEISRFCVAKSHRIVHRGQAVHLGMLKLVYEFACHQAITDLFTLVLPGMEKLYEAVFFRRLNIVVKHPTWGIATAMHLNLDQARSQNRNSMHPIARLLFDACISNIVLTDGDR
jgi:N-acyl-L-homoserine lactone synthetase